MSTTAFGTNTFKKSDDTLKQLNNKFVNVQGDTMSGNLFMSYNQIKQLTEPIEENDAVNLNYINRIRGDYMSITENLKQDIKEMKQENEEMKQVIEEQVEDLDTKFNDKIIESEQRFISLRDRFSYYVTHNDLTMFTRLHDTAINNIERYLLLHNDYTDYWVNNQFMPLVNGKIIKMGLAASTSTVQPLTVELYLNRVKPSGNYFITKPSDKMSIIKLFPEPLEIKEDDIISFSEPQNNCNISLLIQI